MILSLPARSVWSYLLALVFLGYTAAVTQPCFGQASQPAQPKLPDPKPEPAKTLPPAPPGPALQFDVPAAKDVKKPNGKYNTWQILRYFNEAVQLRNFPKESDDAKLTFEEKRKLQAQQYQEATNKFVAEVRRALSESEGLNERLAAVVLICEIAEKDNEATSDNKLTFENQGKILRELTSDFVELSQPKHHWKLRYVALRALGKITPDPDKVVPTIRKNMVDVHDGPRSLERRRAAAYALVDLAKYANLLPRVKDTFPALQLKTIAEVTAAASLGLGDRDEWMRAYSLLAVIEAAQSLANYISPFNAVDTTGKIIQDREISVGNKDFQETFAQFRLVNPGVLHCLHDANPNIQFAALEALDNLFNVRSGIVQYLRRRAENPKDDSRKLLAGAKLRDPLESLVNDYGRPIAELLDKRHHLRERRKAGFLLELMAEDLQLGREAAGPVLGRIVFTLTEKCEDVFVRWSSVNTIKNIIDHEQSLPDKIILMKALTSRLFPPADVTVDMALVRVITDPQSSTRLDPDVTVKVANALEAVADLFNYIEEKKQEKDYLQSARKRVGSEIVALLHEVSWIEPGAGIRFDAETRIAVMKALVVIGGEPVIGGIDSLIQSLQDHDPRVRREAAKAFGAFVPIRGSTTPVLTGALRDKTIDALTRALRDEDVEVRINATESILNLTKRLPRPGL